MKSEAAFKLAKRPKGQSLFRKLCCIGGLCGLLFSSLLLIILVVFYNSKSGELSPIPPDELNKYNQSEIVQPFFIEKTRFDILAAIWSEGYKGNETEIDGGQSGHSNTTQDRLLWKGVLQKNVSFVNGVSENITIPINLNLSHLWTIPKLDRYSLMATVMLFPRMSSTALSLPSNKNLTLEKTSFLLGREGFPVNLDFLDSNELTPDMSEKLRLHFQKTVAMPAHTLPLLFVKSQNERERKQVFINSRIKLRVEHEVDSFKQNAFQQSYNATGVNLGECFYHLSNTSEDTQKEKCINQDLSGPVQSLIKFRESENSTHLQESSRSFFVPHLIAKTSASPRDLIPVSQNTTAVKFDWKSEVSISTALSTSFQRTFRGRNSQSFDQILLTELMQGNGTDQTDGFQSASELFSSRVVLRAVTSGIKDLSEVAIVFFSILYFHTRATTVGLSLPAIAFAASFYLLGIIFGRFLVPSRPRFGCDATLNWENVGLLHLPWIYLALLQLWFVSRLKVERQKGKWVFLTFRRVELDHSERQSSREDLEFSLSSRFMFLMLLTAVFSLMKPTCFYLQIGALGNFSHPKTNFKLVLFALPQVGRLLGEIMQLRLNRQQRTFAGAFKITVFIQVLRHSLDLLHVVDGMLSQRAFYQESSMLHIVINNSSVFVTLAWLLQALRYPSVTQLRDSDHDD